MPKGIKRNLLVILLIVGLGWVVMDVLHDGDLRNVHSEDVASRETKKINFAIISDIHLDFDNLSTAIGMAKSDGMEFMIITGDLTSLGKTDELFDSKEALDKGGLEYYVIPGNHDVWWNKRLKGDNFGEIFGGSFQSFKIEEVKFILIDNADDIKGLARVVGKGGVGQKEWLIQEVEECLKITCLAFAHMPLNHPNSLHIMGEGNSEISSQTGELKKILTENGVKKLYAGHLHFSSRYTLEGLDTTIVGSVARERNLQSPKFLEVTVDGGKLIEKEVFLPN